MTDNFLTLLKPLLVGLAIGVFYFLVAAFLAKYLPGKTIERDLFIHTIGGLLFFAVGLFFFVQLIICFIFVAWDVGGIFKTLRLDNEQFKELLEKKKSNSK